MSFDLARCHRAHDKSGANDKVALAADTSDVGISGVLDWLSSGNDGVRDVSKPLDYPGL